MSVQRVNHHVSFGIKKPIRVLNNGNRVFELTEKLRDREAATGHEVSESFLENLRKGMNPFTRLLFDVLWHSP